MTKVIGCMNCGYRTENKAEIDLFIINGCNCITTQLQKAKDLKLELLKGHNINDPQQVKELAIVKDRIAQLEQELENLENTDTHCEQCDNRTDTPCTDCLWEEIK